MSLFQHKKINYFILSLFITPNISTGLGKIGLGRPCLAAFRPQKRHFDDEAPKPYTTR